MGLGKGKKHEERIAVSSFCDEFLADSHVRCAVLSPQGWEVGLSRDVD